MGKRKVNLKIECDVCYGLVEAEYKSGVYTCRCGREIELEIISRVAACYDCGYEETIEADEEAKRCSKCKGRLV